MIISSLLAAEGLAQLGCALGAGFATIGAGVVFGMIVGCALYSIALHAESAVILLCNMILTAAFVEGCALFAIVACAFLIK